MAGELTCAPRGALSQLLAARDYLMWRYKCNAEEYHCDSVDSLFRSRLYVGLEDSD